jgi:hypothetical protein
MSAERDLLRRAKCLLECSNMEPLQRQSDNIVEGIKELLAQPEQTEQEPVAWMNDSGGCFLSDGNKYSENWIALYTAPPTREPLSEDVIWDNMPENPMECSALAFIRGVKFAEKAHGIGEQK